jgi:ABC-type uncharacterized transport system auxiliary subunit
MIMRATSICVIAVLGMLDAGCIDTRPVHYYTIETPPAPVPPAASTGPALLIGNIWVPQELQDGRIRYRVGSNEVGAYQFHRWSEPLGTMISESLVRTLRASGKYRSVMEGNSSTPGDYVVRGRLYEFDEVDRETIETSISLRVDLVDEKTKLIVWQNLVRHEEPVRSKKVQDVVASLDRNLQAVVKETDDAIGQFLAARR